MGNRITELVTRLIAKDDASKVIEHVADDLDRLEKRKDVEVGVGVEDKTAGDLRKIDDRLDGLSAADKQIVVKAQLTAAQKEVDRLARSLRDVDKLDDEEVKIRVEALGNARAELTQIQEQADKLDKETVDIPVDADTTGIKGKFAQLRTDLSSQGTALGKLGVLGSSAFGSIAAAATAGAATAAVAVTTFVGKATTDFNKLALEIGHLRDSLGIPAEEASKLKEVTEDLGIPMAALEKSIGRMNKVAESTPGAFSGIGAAVVRSSDGALDVTETFLSVATALDRIPDAGERAIAGAKIFGKSWVEIAELVEKGGLSIREAMEQVSAGKIVTDEQIKNAKALRDSLDGLKDRFEDFANTVGKDIGPVVTQISDDLQIAAGAFGAFIKVVTGDFDIPVLDKIARYGFPIIGQINAMADAWGGVKGEIDDLRGVTHGTVDPLMRAIAGTGDLNTALDDLVNKKDPLGQMTDQWKILMDDMADGAVDTQAAADAANLLAGFLGITTDEVLALADAEINKGIADAATAAQELKDHIAEVNVNVEAFKTTAEEVGLALADAMVPLEDGTAAAEAFRTELDKVGRAKGLDTLERFGDTTEAIQGVFKAIKENKGVVPDIFDTGKQSARDFRDTLEEAATAVGDDLNAVLEESGGNFQKVRDRARELRQDMRERFALKLGIDLEHATPEERRKIEALVNAVIPTGKEIELGIKLSKEDLLALKAQLAIEQLKTLLPTTALQLQVDLAEGEIGPKEAAATAQLILDENGVNVDLGVNTKAADDKLVLFARQERITSMGVTVPDAELQKAAFAIDAGPGGTGWPPIEVPVKPVVVPGGYSYITGGGAGTLAAPTATGAAPVTATATGMAPIPIPVTAGRTQVVNQHLTINTAVMGDPFAVTAVVDEAMRRGARLLPKTP